MTKSRKPARERHADENDNVYKLHADIRQPGGLPDFDLLLVVRVVSACEKFPKYRTLAGEVFTMEPAHRKRLSELLEVMKENHELCEDTIPPPVEAAGDRAKWYRAVASLYELCAAADRPLGLAHAFVDLWQVAGVEPR